MMTEYKFCHCSTSTFVFILLCLSFMVTVNLFMSAYHLNAIFDFTLRARSNFQNYIENYQNIATISGSIRDTMDKVGNQNQTNIVRDNAVTNPMSVGALSRITVTAALHVQNSNRSGFHSNGTRKDTCVDCFVHDFKYLINNEKICEAKENKLVDIVILILTIHRHKQQRDAIRKTWLTYSRNNTGNVRYAFLLGAMAKNDTFVNDAVKKEAEIHGDIIKEDFIDAYVNLTYKTIMAFRWAGEYCSHAKFVMKTDDDMWVNVPALLLSVRNNSDTLQKGVGGTCSQKASPIRAKGSKWHASFKSYPHKHFPGFCAGPGYVTSMTVAKKIFEISKSVPFFHLEDVYVSLCIKQLGLKLYRLRYYYNYRAKFDPCFYKSYKVVTSHQVPPRMLYQVWDTKCPIDKYLAHLT